MLAWSGTLACAGILAVAAILLAFVGTVAVVVTPLVFVGTVAVMVTPLGFAGAVAAVVAPLGFVGAVAAMVSLLAFAGTVAVADIQQIVSVDLPQRTSRHHHPLRDRTRLGLLLKQQPTKLHQKQRAIVSSKP